MTNEQLERIQAGIARSESLLDSLKGTRAKIVECIAMGDDVAADYSAVNKMIVQITAVIEQLHVMKDKATSNE